MIYTSQHCPSALEQIFTDCADKIALSSSSSKEEGGGLLHFLRTCSSKPEVDESRWADEAEVIPVVLSNYQSFPFPLSFGNMPSSTILLCSIKKERKKERGACRSGSVVITNVSVTKPSSMTSPNLLSIDSWQESCMLLRVKFDKINFFDSILWLRFLFQFCRQIEEQYKREFLIER